MKLRSQQRGVALIAAVLMVALATVLAVEIGFKAYLAQRRAITLFSLDQAYQMGLGAEAYAAYGLMKSDLKRTELNQAWATPIRNLAVDRGDESQDAGDISGELEDMAGRFNLNLLATPPDNNDTAQQTKHRANVDQFRRIVDMAQLEPEWVDKIVDWIDADTNAMPYGGEDDLYTGLVPPYHTANRNITRTSELLALPEFGIERYRKLEPLVSALPLDAQLNVCTAPGIVLDSLSATQRQYSLDPMWLAKQRQGGCFPDKTTMLNTLTGDERARAEAMLAETSSYFRARMVITIGTAQFTLYSLLKREAAGVRPITRSFGTP